MSSVNATIISIPFDWYMIRNGYLGPDYVSKIVSLVMSIAIILYDSLTRKRLDYLYSFVFGTVLWIILEYVLLSTGVREYQSGFIGGKELGFWPCIILRCLQEAGFLIVLSLFEGDRVFDCLKGKQKRPSNLRRWMEFSIVFVILTCSSTLNMLRAGKETRWEGSCDVAGRRNMTNIVSVFVFLFTTIVSIILLIVFRNRKFFLYRTIGFTIFVTWTSTLGMIIEYNVNARWVEVGHWPDYVAIPTSGMMLLAFLYDLVIEVISPPVFIYHLMVILHILPDFKSDSYFDEERNGKRTLPIKEPETKVIEIEI